MVWNLLSVSGLSFASTYFPRIITINYAFIGGMLINDATHISLSLFSVIAATLGTTSLWFADRYIHGLVTKYVKKKNLSDTNKFLSKTKKRLKKLHDRLHLVTRKDVLFGLVIFGTQAAIPDILVIRAIQGKLPLALFVLATIIGKALVYIPFIYGVELLKVIGDKIF